MQNETDPASLPLARSIHEVKIGCAGRLRQINPQLPERTSLPARATGTFEVKLNPQPPYNDPEGALLGRLSIDKEFKGDLEATSKGEMLTAGTSIKNSAGYVAIERVTGSLNGRTGSFALQHNGTMDRGSPRLTIHVVPDSGTGQLTGLTGTLGIEISSGKHSYVFDYTLPA
jgi:hypothetical protein